MVLSHSAERLLIEQPPSAPTRPRAEEIRDAAARAVALARTTLGETAAGDAARAIHANGAILGMRRIAATLLGCGIEIVLDPDLTQPYVYADPTALGRALVNIAANAHDAMPDGGTFTIRTRQVGDQVVIRLSDTGTGINPALLDAIFEPEFTTKATGSVEGRRDRARRSRSFSRRR